MRSGHDCGRTRQGTADRRSAQRLPRELPRLDDGCLRLLHRGAGLRRHCQGLPCFTDEDGVLDHRDAADAPGGRRDLRGVGRPQGAPSAPAGGRQLLLDGRLRLRLRPVLRLVAGAAPALRHRNGWGVGARRGPGDGEDPRGPAGLLLRTAAAGLRRGVPAGSADLPGDHPLHDVGVAGIVRVQPPARDDQPDPADPPEGVGSVGEGQN